eukprot:CAMPEP_0115124212 /NCGR_PEP_ID=MMETSP0227-20121206/48149_1 /TAXON_ID=89957 /ORGANISM="Polarella glacialis, Strain CCMP 1383" /LENGTH=287 /DNA_ID=CAMNT_0002527023 /DNA_START=160 /DNA_END=1020 /DNA_ORIENTATION=-
MRTSRRLIHCKDDELLPDWRRQAWPEIHVPAPLVNFKDEAAMEQVGDAVTEAAEGPDLPDWQRHVQTMLRIPAPTAEAHPEDEKPDLPVPDWKHWMPPVQHEYAVRVPRTSKTEECEEESPDFQMPDWKRDAPWHESQAQQMRPLWQPERWQRRRSRSRRVAESVSDPIVKRKAIIAETPGKQSSLRNSEADTARESRSLSPKAKSEVNEEVLDDEFGLQVCHEDAWTSAKEEDNYGEEQYVEDSLLAVKQEDSLQEEDDGSEATQEADGSSRELPDTVTNEMDEPS